MKTTKQLARELGLLRKKSVSNRTERISVIKQPFSFLVVLDFESTCWQDGKFRTQEIIEFPAVLLNTTTGEIENEFQFYVQPQEQPTLSDFCKQLTGITQEQVDDGIPLNLCLRKFVRWLDGLKESKGVVFTKITENCKLAAIVTWSDWDLGVCLYNELRRKQITRPSQFNSWIDLRATYRKFYGRKPQGLNGALKDVGIEFEGREHSGLHDSRNTAILAYRMIKDGCILNITKSLKGTSGPDQEKYVPVAIQTLKQLTPSKSPLQKRRKKASKTVSESSDVDFDEEMDNAIASSQEIDKILQGGFVETPERKRKSRIPIPSPKSNKKGTNIKSPPKEMRPTKVKAKRIVPGKFNITDIYVDPQDTSGSKSGCGLQTSVSNKLSNISVNIPFPQKSSKMTPKKTVNSKKGLSSPLKRNGSQLKPSCDKLSRSDTAMKTDPVQGNKSKNETVTSRKLTSPAKLGQIKTPVATQFKTPSNSSSGQFNMPSSLVGPSKTPSIKSFCTSTTPGFRTPAPVSAPVSSNKSSFQTHSARLLPTHLSTPGSGVSINTPNIGKNPSGMKGTPPLCNCGKRSKRRMTQTPGPNLGRFFFTCGSSNYHSKESKKGCGFFKWETPAGNRHQSFTQKGTLSKPFVPVFSNCTPVNSTSKKNLGVRSNSISSFR